MKLLGKQLLSDFKDNYPDARAQIEAWEAEVEDAGWATPHALKSRYQKASLLGDQQVVFDICGNKYRLLAQINYKNQIALVKKIGTHKEYDTWT
ncbi:MAG TPA: type II toxin-antitoxin system HigB family toxin [Candidatus Paceibacterota bacterium]|nr:type II toxin-antitoxin system HigB family toxin [Candidatus Paceibacterota bacterium]